ncbi:hypothetical protein ASPZODRAFT_134669 [Penicilliopsis zonata CBS 506.65]|uniref:Uncharacterized protein n=1 Tax=Penicilliopsis zonata CBS 506.65 TaxID=1073090 RepID=A0A1L9SBX1_9EURO|nr:hypothetical protein ASPZODRAFT_134669 [Penicilliopsis zonata CBS 506.65]OJJ44587.1 hypothetical protein ASPZODRAFT_134669 [Penicilliopsis zonata CBS 506.65]
MPQHNTLSPLPTNSTITTAAAAAAASQHSSLSDLNEQGLESDYVSLWGLPRATQSGKLQHRRGKRRGGIRFCGQWGERVESGSDHHRRGHRGVCLHNEYGANTSCDHTVVILTKRQIVTVAVMFFFIRKRKWDRIRRHERQLLALETGPSHYRSKMSEHSDKYATPRPSYNTARSVDQPPPYGGWARYDPSRYQQERFMGHGQNRLSRKLSFFRQSRMAESRPLSYRPSDDSQINVRPLVVDTSVAGNPRPSIQLEPPPPAAVKGGSKPARKAKPVLSPLITAF